MSRSRVIETAVEIGRTPADVFDYCTDLGHEPSWNPALEEISKVTAGPVGVGTRYAARFVRGDPMVISFVRFDPPSGWATVGESRRLNADFSGIVSPTRDGSRLVFRMDLRPRGVLRLGAPLLRRAMRRAEVGHLAAIKATLEG